MLFFAAVASAFLIKSSTESLYFGIESSFFSLKKNFVMCDNIADATSFFLKSKNVDNLNENRFRVGDEEYLDISWGGSVLLRKARSESTIDAFKIILTADGTFMIQKDDKCLGYEKNNKELELVKCTRNNFNTTFLFEGTDQIANKHKQLYDIPTDEYLKDKADIEMHDLRNGRLRDAALSRNEFLTDHLKAPYRFRGDH